MAARICKKIAAGSQSPGGGHNVPANPTASALSIIMFSAKVKSSVIRPAPGTVLSRSCVAGEHSSFRRPRHVGRFCLVLRGLRPKQNLPLLLHQNGIPSPQAPTESRSTVLPPVRRVCRLRRSYPYILFISLFLSIRKVIEETFTTCTSMFLPFPRLKAHNFCHMSIYSVFARA